VGYRDPLVLGTPLTYSTSALYRREQIRLFANHSMVMQVPTTVVGGDCQIGWVLSPHTRAFLGLSARYQTVDAVEGLAPDAIPLPYNPRSGRIFLLQFQFQYDDTRAEEGLRQGTLLLLKNELSDRYWGSEFGYSKFEMRLEMYRRYRWNYPSIIFKTVFDYPTSARGVPVTEELRIGGPTLRGYLTNEFHGDTPASLSTNVFSKDGAFIFMNTVNGFKAVSTAKLDVQTLTTAGNGHVISYLPDSQTAYFTANGAYVAGLGIADDLYRMPLDHSGPREILATGLGMFMGPVASPSGRYIVFAPPDAASSRPILTVIDTTTGEARPLANGKTSEVTFSPDESWLFLVDDNPTARLAHLSDGLTFPLSSGPYLGNAKFSPSGDRVMYGASGVLVTAPVQPCPLPTFVVEPIRHKCGFSTALNAIASGGQVERNQVPQRKRRRARQDR
jgi:hypothetical protein